MKSSLNCYRQVHSAKSKLPAEKNCHISASLTWIRSVTLTSKDSIHLFSSLWNNNVSCTATQHPELLYHGPADSSCHGVWAPACSFCVCRECLIRSRTRGRKAAVSTAMPTWKPQYLLLNLEKGSLLTAECFVFVSSSINLEEGKFIGNIILGSLHVQNMPNNVRDQGASEGQCL